MTYRWLEKKCHSGKQFDLIDVQGRPVARVQPAFPDWEAHILTGVKAVFAGTKQACVDVVEREFGISKPKDESKQGELF